MDGDTIACTNQTDEEFMSAETNAAVEIFKKLSPEEQDAIISMIKSLLSEQ